MVNKVVCCSVAVHSAYDFSFKVIDMINNTKLEGKFVP